MAVTQQSPLAEAIAPYLAPGESVDHSYRVEYDHGERQSYYALTDRRFIELSQGEPDDADQRVTFEAYPLEEASTVQVRREKSRGGFDDEYTLAGLISMIAAGFLAFLPLPGGLSGFALVGSGLFAVIALILFLAGYGVESGELQLSISQETGHKSVSLPLEGEEFAQTVASEIGRRQP